MTYRYMIAVVRDVYSETADLAIPVLDEILQIF